ncbi:MAG: acyltransferase family protein [Eubacterium sp.]|nr:acyltransferase family protein [Eubacterium sp.]
MANSHFKGIYPIDLLAFGGGYGVAIFFLVAGFLSANITENTKFLPWIIKKASRLYIPLWVFRIVELAVGFKEISSVYDVVTLLIFPGTWFGAAILILDCVYFISVKYAYIRSNMALKASIIGCFIIYVLLCVLKPSIASFSIQTLEIEKFGIETPYFVTGLIWCACMLIGYGLRKNVFLFIQSDVVCICYVLLSLIVFFAIKMLSRLNYDFGIEIMLGPLYICFSVGLFSLFSNIEFIVNDRCKAIRKMAKGIGKYTLEIFYTQFIFISIARNIVFPVNIVFLIIAIAISSVVLKKTTNWIMQKSRLERLL